jgi:hypothetical protein
MGSNELERTLEVISIDQRDGLMRRLNRLLAVGLGLVLSISTVAVVAAAAPTLATAIPSIGIQNVQLNGDFVPPANPDEMAAFVETGSLDSRCLATLAEANFAGGVGIKMLFCNPRQIERDGRLMSGLALRIFFDGDAPEDVIVHVNYYQERMRTNPAPIPCNGDC